MASTMISASLSLHYGLSISCCIFRSALSTLRPSDPLSFSVLRHKPILLYFLYMHRGSDLVDSVLQFHYAILHQKLTLHGALFCSIQRRVSYFLRHCRLIPIFSPFLFSSVIMLDVFHRYLPFSSFLCCNALCGEGFAILFSFIMPIFNLTNLDHLIRAGEIFQVLLSLGISNSQEHECYRSCFCIN